MSDRDTHFQGFARLLWEEMLSQTQSYYIDVSAGHIPLHHPEDEEHKIYIDLIAQRAYDLVCHIVTEMNYGLDTHTIEDAVATLPDMTEWPPS